MRDFAELLDRLVFTPRRSIKLRLIGDYFARVPDPDRGWALAALTGGLTFRGAKPAMIRALIEERCDPVLFRWSYDFVGDLAESAALLWPERRGANREPGLAEVVETLQEAGRTDVPALLAGWLDALDPTGRWALLKLITGGLRVGVSERLAKTALANFGGQDAGAIEELWHGLRPPYRDLFAWLEGRAPQPEVAEAALFRPLMLAHPLEEAELDGLPLEEFQAEWKWDGIRAQLVAHKGECRLFSRTGEDIGPAFPDLLQDIGFDAVLDGELLVAREGAPAPFNELQTRLGRKAPTAKLQRSHPAHLRLYDLLIDAGEDLRPLTFSERRARLEAWYARHQPGRMDLSELVVVEDYAELRRLRREARASGVEGLMLKRAASPYLAGRPKGHWYKFKRDALTVDAVLMYAQRGHGRRSSLFSDYTFGAWTEAGTLVPIGKAYSGFTDAELARLDKWVRDHTVDRFGPVRAVEPGLVLEVAFDAVQPSSRHKSGIALRFPRIARIRWDKPAGEADPLERLRAMIA
ncbi:cisplatin damage response ATP-dependent DNA ligase [Aquibaculum sediminis]|uniref:cisplatin damage response ATP-dependent DNA ligase n=1 Tax=Aquibaculum sediminis TaxID=3231907 RepID=UPI003451666C